MKLTKYLDADKARLALENQGLWFTRARNWSSIDPQETAIMPALERYLDRAYGEDLRKYLFLAMCEFQSGWVWGSCFSKSTEVSDHMWHEFGGGELKPGVVLTIDRDFLFEAVANACLFDANDPSRGYVKVEPVVYLDDEQFTSLEVLGDPNKYQGGMFEAGVYYKSYRFRNENEVRAIISRNARFDFALKDYCERTGIPIGPASQPVEKDRISFVLSYGPEHSKHNWGVSLSRENLFEFREELRSDRFQTAKDWNGFYVPIVDGMIEDVRVSPFAGHMTRSKLLDLANQLKNAKQL